MFACFLNIVTRQTKQRNRVLGEGKAQEERMFFVSLYLSE